MAERVQPEDEQIALPRGVELFVTACAPWLVVMAAAACCIFLYAQYWHSARLLWNDVVHDRNAHLYSGLCLATDLRLGDLRHLLGDFDSFRTWPPLHDGILVGLCLLIGRADERFAVLPSLVAWAGSAVFAFLLARRALPAGGTIAGLVAALFVLVSPAQRAYATDVMLESSGACLTLACLYYYVASMQDESPGSYRALALSLTLLFFTKYNYWLLVVFGLIAHKISLNPQGLIRLGRERLNYADAGPWVTRQLRIPVNYAAVAILTACLLIAITGGFDATLLGRHLTVRPSANIASIVYVVCFLRLIPWYRSVLRPQLRQAPAGTRILAAWHVWPLALWFLWPQRLYSFMWVANPAANVGETPHWNLLGGYSYYWHSLTHDYHVGLWSAVTAILLSLAATAAGIRGTLRPGATAVFWLIAIAFVLTVHHPNRKSRFLHSWLPAVWVAAGIGLGTIVPVRRNRKSAGYLAACGLGAGALILTQIPALRATAHSPEGGIHAFNHSSLDITDAYLPDLAATHHAAVFSNMPMKFLSQWTYMKRYPRSQRLETDVKGFDPTSSDNRLCFRAWLATTDCDTIVYIDFPRGTPFYSVVPGSEKLCQYGDMLNAQTRFSLKRRIVFPQYGCTATVWTRCAGQPSPQATGAGERTRLLPHPFSRQRAPSDTETSFGPLWLRGGRYRYGSGTGGERKEGKIARYSSIA